MTEAMSVQVMEMGDRPITLTRARRYAPAGAAVLGEVLGQQRFADFGFVVLDWSNVTKQQPDEVARPVLFVQVQKFLPEYESRNKLTVEVRLDVEDIFGGDTITAESILNIVNELREKVDEQVAQRRAMG